MTKKLSGMPQKRKHTIEKRGLIYMKVYLIKGHINFRGHDVYERYNVLPLRNENCMDCTSKEFQNVPIYDCNTLPNCYKHFHTECIDAFLKKVKLEITEQSEQYLEEN